MGIAGAIVYATGRSSLKHITDSDYPYTIEDTAEEVNRRGGVGIGIPCDHTVDSEVKSLFERIKNEQGHLDILVNNVWCGYMPYEEHNKWFDHTFWEQSMERWNGMFEAGLRAHIVTNLYGIPIMLRSGGLIVSTSYWNRGEYLGLLFYDVAKCAINRMAYDLSIELSSYQITSVSISPGWMRVERMYRNIPKSKLNTIESPEYTGRCILALYLDVNRLARSGNTFEVGELGKEYGVIDIDGKIHDYHSEIRNPSTNPHLR